MVCARIFSGVRLLSGLLLLAWPFVIWLGLRQHNLRWLLLPMVLLLFFRIRHVRPGPLRAVAQAAALAGMALCVASFLLKTHQLLLFYPVVVNGVMLAVFGGSLWSTMPIIERLARLRNPELPLEAITYTRRVTRIWCLFFIINGGLALFTALYGNITLWTAWNGIIAYLLMGSLMVGEWLVRRRVIQRELQ